MSGFSVERNELLAALTMAKAAVAKRNTIPILNNILLKAAGKELHITATNLDIQIETSCSADFDGFEQDTIAGHALASFVDKAREDKPIKATSDGRTMRFQSARTHTTLASLPADTFPTFNQAASAYEFELGASDLKRAFDKCSNSISTEETRYYLNGIYMHHDGVGHLIFVATDGHRLTKCTVPAPEGTDKDLPGVIIPRGVLPAITSLLSESEKSKRTPIINLSDSQIRISSGSASITSKLIDGTFPDYQRVFPQSVPNKFTLATADMARAMGRMAVVEGGYMGAVFEFGTDTAVIMRKGENSGESITDEIPLECHGEPVRIAFNCNYMAELMAAISTENFDIMLDDGGSPCLITPTDSDNQSSVLMPARC